MAGRLRHHGWMGGVALLFLWLPSLWSQEVPAGQVWPLEVRQGKCEAVLPTPAQDDKYFLVVGSLAREAGPFRVTVRTAADPGPVSLPRESPSPDRAWQQRLQDVNERLARVPPAPAEEPRPVDQPPSRKTFYLFVGDHDFQNPASYAPVTGELRAVGRHCQVYVDLQAPERQSLQPTVDDVVAAFDQEIYPEARRAFGQVRDVDGDGRFTILFSGWLSKLSRGKVSLGGFVRGSDFFADLPEPFGNHCDMLYLNSNLKPGPYLRTLVAHEYTHAVIFSEHYFGSYLPEQPHRDEEGWLNEALAHLAEDQHSYSWSNLDYRISTFLSAPEQYQLVVPDYYNAGLWRSHGHRGSTYLFVRWCADRFGPDLPGRLVRTNLAGVDNVETAMQEHWADLFRQWTAALVLSGTNLAAQERGPGRPGYTPLRRVDLHGPLAGRLLCGPRYQPLPLAEGSQEVTLAGTAAAMFLLHSPKGTCSRLTVAGPSEASLQVSLIRLPGQTARLSLHHEGVAGSPNAVRLVLTVHDADVTLDGAAWERLVPTADHGADTSYRSEVDGHWFGDPRVKAGEARTSILVPVPEGSGAGQPVVFKVAATDTAGHHLAAWDVVEEAGQEELPR